MSRSAVRGKLVALIAFAMVATLVQAAWAPPAVAEVEPECYSTNEPISGGDNHTLFLHHDGTVWGAGWNAFGQLGDGTTVWERLEPVQTVDLSGIVAVAAGTATSYALAGNGDLWAWGRNEYGELGDGTTIHRSTPVRVQGLPPIEQIEAGQHYAIALARDGSVWGWGRNDKGQLGNGSRTDSTVPVQVSGLVGVDSITIGAGGKHTLAVLPSGDVFAWGDNAYGALGDGTEIDRDYPVRVKDLSDVIQVDAGSDHSLALKSDGTAWAWGNNFWGQIGDGGPLTKRLTPVQVANLTNLVISPAVGATRWRDSPR